MLVWEEEGDKSNRMGQKHSRLSPAYEYPDLFVPSRVVPAKVHKKGVFVVCVWMRNGGTN